MRLRSQILVGLAALVIAATSIATSYVAQRKLDAVAETLSTLGAERSSLVDPLETTWTDAAGRQHTVTTEWQKGETAAQQAARHAERVEALEAIFPPVGGSGN